MQNIKKRTFWLLAIIGLLFVITGCSKGGNDDLGKMKISFANTSYEYVVGETFTLNPSIQNGTPEDQELEWTIFDESVVKLINGEFVALKEGKTVVKVASVTKPEVNAMVSVKVVRNQYFPLVTFNDVADVMNVDETQLIMATLEGANFEANITYRSLDSNVASVNENGVVEADVQISRIGADHITCDGGNVVEVIVLGGGDALDVVAHLLCLLEGLAGEVPFSTRNELQPFASEQSGTIPGEGGAFFVLKRRADALRDHDRIYALIRSVCWASLVPSF